MKKLKVLLLIFLLAFSTGIMAQVRAPVQYETAMAPSGYSIIRFYNPNAYWIVCQYRDNAQFQTFRLAPYSWGDWGVYYGRPQFQCVFV